MNMESWMQELIKQIENSTGAERAAHFQTVILPQIIADYYRMLKEAPIGKPIREDYRMEDASMTITLEGNRNRSGFEILRAYISK